MSDHEAGAIPRINDDPRKIPHDILIAEFEYLASAAQQAGEEHARVPQYYFMALGSLGASLFSLPKIPDLYLPWVHGGLSLLFLLFAAQGWMTVEQLIRLRQAWLKNSLAMDAIKEYYIRNFKKFKLPTAILIRPEGLPDPYRRFSISHLLAIATFVMSGLSIVIAAFFLELLRSGCPRFDVTIFIGVAAALTAGVGLQKRYRNALEKFESELQEIRIKEQPT